MFYAFSSLVCITATVGGLYLGVARMQTPAGNDIYKSACVLQLGADDDPEFAAAFIASTAARFSLDVGDAIGRLVKERHFACMSSMTLIVSLRTMHAAAASLKSGLLVKPIAL